MTPTCWPNWICRAEASKSFGLPPRELRTSGPLQTAGPCTLFKVLKKRTSGSLPSNNSAGDTILISTGMSIVSPYCEETSHHESGTITPPSRQDLSFARLESH